MDRHQHQVLALDQVFPHYALSVLHDISALPQAIFYEKGAGSYMSHKLIGFADGENIVFRYQDMISKGAIPKPDVVHIPDTLVWHPGIMECFCSDVVRVLYYQTCVGDGPKVDLFMSQVKNTRFTYSTDPVVNDGSGTLMPRIFKKEKKTSKAKSVDINLTIEMLRYSYNPQIDVLFLLSGDGDYVPLIEEASRNGKQVWVAAFSDGLNSRIPLIVDEFIDLDELFFEKKAKSANATISDKQLRVKKQQRIQSAR